MNFLVDNVRTPTNTGQPELEQYRVERVVGQILLRMGLPNEIAGDGAAFGNVFLDIGIALVNSSAIGGPDQFDPSQVNDADFSWLALRHYVSKWTALNAVNVGVQGLPVDPTRDWKKEPKGFDWDVRVRRRVRPNQSLVLINRYSADVPAGGVAMEIEMIPYLRTLISRAI